MSRVQQLPSDQSAVLSLLLRQRKTYAQVASMLAIEEGAVRDRAYQAIGTLGASEGTSLLHTQRQEIGDYLLGQRDSLSHSTRTYLEGLANTRAWAVEVRSQLQEISPDLLPQIPGDEQSAPAEPEPYVSIPIAEASLRPLSPAGPPPSSGTSTAPVSRRGGVLLLGGIVVVIIAAVIIITNSGGGKSKAATQSPPTPANRGSSSGTSSTGTSSTSTAGTSSLHIDNQLNLVSPQATSAAKGIVEIASEGSKYAFYIIAEHLPPSSGFFYVAWLSNSRGQAEALGKAPTVTSNGRLQGAGKLPANASKYNELILTKETSEHASSPGEVVLESPFSLKAKGSKSSSVIGGTGSTGASGSAEGG